MRGLLIHKKAKCINREVKTLKIFLTWLFMWITIAMVIHIQGGPIVTMRTVQMTLDDDLVEAVDRAAKRLHTSRSAFTRDALRDALTRYSVARLEQKHRRGYKAQPVEKGEFSVWEDEQAWGGE